MGTDKDMGDLSFLLEMTTKNLRKSCMESWKNNKETDKITNWIQMCIIKIPEVFPRLYYLEKI